MPRPNHGILGLSFLACRALQFACLVVVMGLTARFIGTMVDSVQQPPPPIVGALSVTCFAILYTIITIILYWDQQMPLLATAGVDTLFFIALMTVSIIVGKPLSFTSCRALSSDRRFPVPGELATVPTAPASTPTARAATEFTPEAVPTPSPVAPVTATSTYVTSTLANAAATVTATLTPGGQAQVQGSDGQFYNIAGQRLAKKDLDSAVMKAVDYSNWVTNGTETSCMQLKAIWGLAIALTILFVFSTACLAFVWKKERAPAPKKLEDSP